MTDKVRNEDSGGRARWRRCGTTGMDTAVEEMRYGKRRNVGQQKWRNGLDERRRTGKYQQGTTTNLRAYCRSNNLGVGATTELHCDSGCIWRLFVSYFNLNKITRWFKYPSWRFYIVIIHPGKSIYRITKGESLLFCTTTSVMFEFTYEGKN